MEDIFYRHRNWCPCGRCISTSKQAFIRQFTDYIITVDHLKLCTQSMFWFWRHVLLACRYALVNLRCPRTCYTNLCVAEGSCCRTSSTFGAEGISLPCRWVWGSRQCCCVSSARLRSMWRNCLFESLTVWFSRPTDAYFPWRISRDQLCQSVVQCHHFIYCVYI